MSTRVVVLGGGYAGLLVAGDLARELPRDAEVHVVDEDGEHVVSHLLHRALRRPALAATLRLPLADLLEGPTLHRARVTGVDPRRHEVHLADRADPGQTPETMAYDVGVVCLGARPDTGDVAGATAHATTLTTLEDVARLRERFEALAADPDGGRVAVVGGGLAGVEVAAELAALARERDAGVDVYLLEAERTVAPGFPREFRIAVRRELRTRGVTVRPDSEVVAATPDGVRLSDGTHIDCGPVVLETGATGPAALDGERAAVDATLAWGADPAGRTFALGDAARVVDDGGEPVPATARAATCAAGPAARNAASVATADGGEAHLEGFAYDASGWLVSIGDGAVAQAGPTAFTGAAAKALKSQVSGRYLAAHDAVADAVETVREAFRPPLGGSGGREPATFDGPRPAPLSRR
ncbi:MAG: NAD(P)/FAD-dependent oxidoreductase [Halobacteriaceae archaeon]